MLEFYIIHTIRYEHDTSPEKNKQITIKIPVFKTIGICSIIYLAYKFY